MLITVMDSDSLYMTADTLFSFKDSADYRSLFGFHHVRIFKSDLQGLCDSVAFSYRDSIFRLFGNPVLWVDDNQLKADTMRMILKNEKLYKMDLIQNAIAVNEADTMLYNQIQGKDMFGYFDDGRMQRMEVEGNGESIYYAQDDSDAYIGVNKSICSNMVIYFTEDREVDRIYFITEPDATLYPYCSFPGKNRGSGTLSGSSIQSPNQRRTCLGNPEPGIEVTPPHYSCGDNLSQMNFLSLISCRILNSCSLADVYYQDPWQGENSGLYSNTGRPVYVVGVFQGRPAGRSIEENRVVGKRATGKKIISELPYGKLKKLEV
jgi:hypothetical protein